MGEKFDPYRQWLGISAHEHPINHYRLLGIDLFESDHGVIAAAADRRMRAIRKHQTGPRGVATQKILNEISAAKLCLLDVSARSAYDEMLRGLAAATHAAHAPTAGRERPATIEIRKPTVGRRSRRRAYYRQPWFPIIAVIAIFSIAFVVWATGRAWFAAPATRQSRETPETGVPPTRPAIQELGQSTPEPIVVQQEASGQINLSPALAVLEGDDMALTFESEEEVVRGWKDEDDTARWRFQLRKVPPQGVFRLKITYAGRPNAAYTLQLGLREAVGYTRESETFVTDEHFLQIQTTGAHDLLLRAAPAGDLRVKRISLAFPNDTQP